MKTHTIGHGFIMCKGVSIICQSRATGHKYGFCPVTTFQVHEYFRPKVMLKLGDIHKNKFHTR
ncbi:hypothetical protein HanRHA438_Chr10g0450691 [Helianthus annuus]|uniref:Uncharacterized protein n=1 Tax=Helianthus annuus TaxID=4232 RepID=A0A251TLB4_HELAN|nr:hypothetical protein HanXRQr2_Chr10g0438651 [Helianthus annuus]KAJ0513703.1 hypothetical protein HanHA300_Chr10g0360791 [Helianthus annuus]KAJ0521597.1 hypothetical protein HanIR_Chr10g0472781 [Helianthus annuus]KAJ0529805.1 hypothetical protein HanHA89_Chr10g0382221 [Helianthus annuus]KAJ0696680.1 hypothetical protein HanLR1_Chr10g0359981 [Helianthus annuus]